MTRREGGGYWEGARGSLCRALGARPGVRGTSSLQREPLGVISKGVT